MFIHHTFFITWPYVSFAQLSVWRVIVCVFVLGAIQYFRVTFTAIYSQNRINEIKANISRPTQTVGSQKHIRQHHNAQKFYLLI